MASETPVGEYRPDVAIKARQFIGRNMPDASREKNDRGPGRCRM
jgi:hypothetical protein